MARGKVQMRKVENPVHRQVTFCKRRTGLFKKARELSVLCDADIGIMVFSSHGKLFELSTKGTMQDLIERYNKMYQEVQSDGTQLNQPQDIEISRLKQEINLLQKGLRTKELLTRYMLGEGLTGPLALDELHALERHLNTWMQHIRTTKMHVMFQEIQSLKNKEGELKATNELRQERVVEKAVAFGVAPLTIEQSGVLSESPVTIEHDGLFSVASMISDIQYPLTTQNDYSNFRSSASGCCSYW